jgi:hypothetical protein
MTDAIKIRSVSDGIVSSRVGVGPRAESMTKQTGDRIKIASVSERSVSSRVGVGPHAP